MIHLIKGSIQTKLNKISLTFKNPIINKNRHSIFLGLMILVLIVYSFSMTLISSKLYATTISNKSTISTLENTNTELTTQVESLQSEYDLVSEKINRLNDLENQVRDLVGLETSLQSSQPVVSRSIVSRRSTMTTPNTILNTAEAIAMPLPVDIDDSMDDAVDQKIDEMNTLVIEVKNKLNLLAAIPDRMPVKGTITSPFGYRTSPINGTRDFHPALDIANSKNTKIYAAGSGTVIFSGWKNGYGNTIIISHHNGYTTLYAHNNSNVVKKGTEVEKGDLIALMGTTGISTGNHVHFEVRYNGTPINPLKILK